MLDADERASAELWKQIEALVKRQDAGAATVRMRNVQSHGHVRETRLLRLFRRDELIAYRYPIHEDATASVQAYLSRTGRLLVHLNGTVEHLGYVREYARARGKKDRDKALLEAHLRSEPDNLYTHLKLLELGRFWSDPLLTASAAPGAREALERAGAKELRDAPWAGELVVLIANALWPERAGQGARLPRVVLAAHSPLGRMAAQARRAARAARAQRRGAGGVCGVRGAGRAAGRPAAVDRAATHGARAPRHRRRAAVRGARRGRRRRCRSRPTTPRRSSRAKCSRGSCCPDTTRGMLRSFPR